MMKECAKNWNFHLLVMGREGVRNHLNQAAVPSTWYWGPQQCPVEAQAPWEGFKLEQVALGFSQSH